MSRMACTTTLLSLFMLLAAAFFLTSTQAHITTTQDSDATSYIFRPLYPHALHRQIIPPSNPPAVCDTAAEQVLTAERELNRLIRQRLVARRRVEVLIARRERRRERLARLRDQLGPLVQQRLDAVNAVRDLRERLRNGDQSVRPQLAAAERRLEQISDRLGRLRERVSEAVAEVTEAARAVTEGWRVVATIVQAVRRAREALREAREVARECGLDP